MKNLLIRKIINYFFLGLMLLFGNLAFADDTFINQPRVQHFIKQMVKKHHFKEQELVSLFKEVKVRPKVMHSIKYPLEQKPWYSYQMLFVTEWRIREGVKFWNKYADALKRAEKEYGVPASIIVATIGVETKYGKNTGNYRVIDALTNIAFSDSPRANYFLKELEQFLLLTREQHLNPLKVLGSYAGAIGQPQFMPSSYRNYAVNFSGNRTIDLSNNEVDVIGSIANYYKKHGWLKNQPVVTRASVTGYNYQRLSATRAIPMEELPRYGILPQSERLSEQRVKLISLKGAYRNEYWIGYHNFDVIKRYNTSDLYAMAVYQLSEYIAELRERLNNA